MNILKKIEKWWWFTFRNPVIRKGEAAGFKWVFRRLDMEIRTVSGNFFGKWTASEHPYGYLLSGKDDDNIHGFCQIMYYLGCTVTTDQVLVNDIQKAFDNYKNRICNQIEIVDDENEEKIATEEVKAVQEVVEMPKNERKRYERDVNGRFKKAVKEAEKSNE